MLLNTAASRLARHTSLGSNVARYTSIHAFFARQASTTALPNALPKRITSIHIAHHEGQHMLSRINIRSYRASTPKAQDLKPQHSSPDSPKHHPAPPPPDQPPPPPSSNLSNYPEFVRTLIQNAPHLHRPTRDELLDLATGFWQRARIRFKWFTIRSFRKFNADDISAFVTLVLFSQTVWVLVGT
jgi:distribution and morphology protein 31